MVVRSLEARGVRNLDHASVELDDGVSVVHGANGAGKTNLLEAICAGLTGASWRTRSDRELIGFDHQVARAEVTVDDAEESRRFALSVSAGDGRRHRLNGKPTDTGSALLRPAVTVFSPDRLTLIKGPPDGRRRHVDRLVAALWPARADLRRRFGRVLAQRNALVARIRSGAASEGALDAWDAEFAVEAGALVETRAATIERLAAPFASLAAALGLPGEATVRYRPRTGTPDVGVITEQLRERRSRDVERARTTHGPHLDEIELALDGRAVRRFGSQGEQRGTLLALLLAERDALLDARRTPPLMLLDDVMSELDPRRRELLIELLTGAGQALIATTELGQVPGANERAQVRIDAGRVVTAARPQAIAA